MMNIITKLIKYLILFAIFNVTPILYIFIPITTVF